MFYEFWHVTGEWAGPEAPHPIQKATQSDDGAKGEQLKASSSITSPLLSGHPYILHRYHALNRS